MKAQINTSLMKEFPQTQKAEPFDPALATMINYSKYYFYNLFLSENYSTTNLKLTLEPSEFVISSE